MCADCSLLLGEVRKCIAPLKRYILHVMVFTKIAQNWRPESLNRIVPN